jgi:hypothetical protein
MYTNYAVSRPGFIADPSSASRVSRQVDFSRVPTSFQDADGNKVVSGATIVSELGSGKVVPRSSTKGTISNLTETGETATATEADHGREVGDTIVVSGAAQAGYNGTWVIASVVDEDSYTFDVGATVADDAGGATVIVPSSGILEASAVENSENAALSGQSMLIGGAVYADLLEDAADNDFETYKTELKAAGIGWYFEKYADNRAS